jgi:hypothetical protein
LDVQEIFFSNQDKTTFINLCPNPSDCRSRRTYKRIISPSSFK